MDTSIELGPDWEPEPEEYAPGLKRYWLRSRRFGVAQNEEDAWTVIDAEGNATHGDIIPELAEARELAERCDAAAAQAGGG
jgi:hypothetical protein